uniref:BTB domain-containing protein n=1 Tax=Panagrolaimus davidi TaxID=227884 RepID=A0A914QN96_9BILA
MNELFVSKAGSDVTFIVHEKEIQAHKLIVTARSPYLFKLLGSFYDVQYLLDKCTEKINIRLSDPELYDPKEAFKYAELGLLYSPGTDELLRICLKCISGCKASFNYRDSDGEVKWISFELALRIVQVCRRTKILDESNMFKNTFEWAKNDFICQNQREPTPKEIQECMAPFMPHFDLKNISPTILATIIKTNKLIADDKLLNIFADLVLQNKAVHFDAFCGIGERCEWCGKRTVDGLCIRCDEPSYGNRRDGGRASIDEQRFPRGYAGHFAGNQG